MPIPDPDKIWPKLDELGVDEVRKKLAMGVYAKYKVPVIEEWLRRRENEMKDKESNDTARAMPPDDQKQPLIFISYDTRDIELVNAIDGILKRIFGNKIKTFIAKRDIKAGDDASKTMLHDNLSNSSVVLSICTKRSINSKWLWFESGAGFGSSVLIPIWAGITPQEFKEPMKIFQGKNVEDKDEMQNLIDRLAQVTKIECSDCSLTMEELNKLKQLCSALGSVIKDDGNERIEEAINFQLIAPNEVMPVQYLIEAHFPLSRSIPLQSLMEVMEKSKIVIKSTESHFRHDYPIFDAKGNKRIGNDVLILNVEDQSLASNDVKQTMFVKSNSITITYWARHFRWELDKNVPTINPIYAREINEECVKLFLFYRKIARNLGLSTMNVRIRLFHLQNGILLTDGVYFQPSLESFRAPDTNEVEVEREINVNNTPKQEYMELLMHVWETFRSANGSYPTLKEKDFSWLEDKLEM